MKIELVEIPGMTLSDQTRWRIRALALDGQSPVLTSLLQWATSQKTDYNKIIKVMRIVGQSHRVTNQKHVRKSGNSSHDNVYEMRADKSHARVMFFYDTDQDFAICTHRYWKGKGHSSRDQATAFDQCERLREIYFQNKS